MEKKYQNMIAAAQKRRDELKKQLDPLRREREIAGAEHQALQRERAELQDKIKRFEADELDLSDQEFLDAEDRIRLLSVRSRRAGETYARAAGTLNKAEHEANSELSQLHGQAMTEFDREQRDTRAELDRALRGLVA